MTSPETVDVIVAGAGPAGLQAAITAAQLRASVLVFDKKAEIGVPVKCGEYFPSKSEMLALLPESRDFEDLFEIPANAIANECDTLRMYSPLGKCWEFPFAAHVLDRTSFERHMAKEARAAGVEFRLGSAVQLFENNGRLRVGSDYGKSIGAAVVIAADGFPSTVASSAGLADNRYSLPENVAINHQYLMDDLSIESNIAEMYMGTSIAPGGYAWIIPKNDTAANVGVGLRTPFMKRGPGRDYLDHFVRRCPFTANKLASGKIQTMTADVLPIDGATSRTCSNSLLLVGDSACLVMPTNGGGIPTAMISGRIAGEVAAVHVQKGEPLSNYEHRWKRSFGRELSASARLRRFADLFMRHDRVFDWTMRVLRTGGIKKVVTCKIPSGLDPVMKLFGF